jgi:uncharacterized OB-fold protein
VSREIPHAADPFWEGLAEGQFRVPVCLDCETAFFPPAPLCPHCGHGEAEWTDAGRGTLYSFTRQHRTAPGFDSPIVMGIVELDAGPRLLAPVAADYDDLTIGQSVQLDPRPYDHDYDRGDRDGDPFFAAVPEVER